MTISGYLVRLLKQYEGLEIETNHVKDGADQNGLFKSPAREFSRRIDTTAVIKENYQMIATMSNVSEYDRRDSDEWLENLTYWIDDYDILYGYPPIDGGRKVTGIEVTGCPYPYETDDNKTAYQLMLSITYEREVNDQGLN